MQKNKSKGGKVVSEGAVEKIKEKIKGIITMNINESTLREYVNNVVNKLIEDIQTPKRAEQQRKRIKSAERSAIFGSWRNRADSIGRLRQLQRIDKREKEDTKTTWGVSEPHHIRGHDESTPRRSRKRK